MLTSASHAYAATVDPRVPIVVACDQPIDRVCLDFSVAVCEWALESGGGEPIASVRSPVFCSRFEVALDSARMPPGFESRVFASLVLVFPCACSAIVTIKYGAAPAADRY